MKIVVFGPQRRTGALVDGTVVDLSHACAKYLHEKQGEPASHEMAEALVPSDLGRLIEGDGARALDTAQRRHSTISQPKRRTSWAPRASRSSGRPPRSGSMRRAPTTHASRAPGAISPTMPRRWR